MSELGNPMAGEYADANLALDDPINSKHFRHLPKLQKR